MEDDTDGLNTRAYRVLKDNNLDKAAIRAMTEAELLRLPNCGRQTVEMLRAWANGERPAIERTVKREITVKISVSEVCAIIRRAIKAPDDAEVGVWGDVEISWKEA